MNKIRVMFFLRSSYISIIAFFAIVVLLTKKNTSLPIILKGTLNNEESKNFVDTGCTLCNFKPLVRTGDSTEKDLILTFTLNRLTNVHAFVSSCRTAGCRAHIVTLIDSNTLKKYDDEYFQQLRNCGVELIDIGDHREVDRTNIFFIRYIFFNNYLSKHGKEFKRVVICDLFDAVFQHDPFTPDFKDDTVYFASEHQKMITNKFNKIYTKGCFNNLYRIDPTKQANKELEDKLFEGDIINCGLIGGGIEPIHKFIKYMLKIGDPSKKIAYADDQGCLNLFIRGKFFDELFKYQIDAGNGSFLVSFGNTYFYRSGTLKDMHLGQYDSGNNIPAIIHQINRCNYIAKDIKFICPANIHNYDSYVPSLINHGVLWTTYFTVIRKLPHSIDQTMFYIFSDFVILLIYGLSRFVLQRVRRITHVK